MELGTVVSIVLSAVVCAVGVLQGYHLHYLKQAAARRIERDNEKEKMRKSELEVALNTGKGWVGRLENDVTHLEERLSNLDANSTKLEKELRVVQSQLMTESKVDSKLQPIHKKIDQSVLQTSAELREMKDQNKHLESMLLQVSGQLNRVVGFLEAKKDGGV